MFSSEQHLVRSFRSRSKATKKILRAIGIKKEKKVHVLEEYDSSNGVADLVIVTAEARKSMNQRRKPIHIDWVSPLSLIPRNSTLSLDEFQSWLGISRSTALKRVRDYVTSGFLSEIRPYQYKKVKEYKLVLKEVIAIEAKLRNWKRALLQALRYKRFSHYSFVLLDEKHSRQAIANIRFFKEANIGLITLDSQSLRLLVHYLPYKKGSPAKDSSYRLNEALYSRTLH